MRVMEIFSLGALGFVLYTYAGYPLLLALMASRKKPLLGDTSYTPSVTILFAAHNEQACLEKTLRSMVAVDYPEERLNVVVVSDGSTDRTDAIAQSYGNRRVRLVRFDDRRGKVLALKQALPRIDSELLVLTDASSVFQPDTVKRLVRHFHDSRVGSVGGSKQIRKLSGDVSAGDGLYLRYDALLRSLESRCGASWVGCEGGIYAIRRPLFKLDYSPDLANDYAVCCRVYEQGFLNRYDPSAVVFETASKNFSIEWSRKIRVIVRGIRAFFEFRHLLNPIKHLEFSFQNYSHRLCRWLVPFCLIALFILSFFGQTPWLRVLFWAQIVGYGLAFLGGTVLSKPKRTRIFSIPLYFSVVNLAALTAWFVLFKRFSTWTPTLRDETR